MNKILIIVTSRYGYDGISILAKNYCIYQERGAVAMDFVTINAIDAALANRLEQDGGQSYVVPYRNSRPLKYMKALRAIMRQGRYDAVHVHGNSATMLLELMAAKRAGVAVRIAHSHNTRCDHMAIHRMLLPFFYRTYTHAFACSREAGQWLFGDKPCSVMNNGIDCARYAYDPAVRRAVRRRLGFGEEIVVGHIGRFSHQKNHVFLLGLFEAFKAAHPEARLLLLGDGELKPEMMERTRGGPWAGDVVFAGNTDAVADYIQAMDIFVLPSLFEGFPIVTMEAQAGGLPCLLSDAMSPQVRLSDQVDFLALDAGSGAWAARMDDLLARTDRGRPADDAVSACFDIRQNCRDYVRLLDTMINGQAGGGEA